MSIPSQVLENGQYVTRMLDPYQILARNRVRQEDKHESIAEPAKAPLCAILTQSLIRTPSIRWIFPARLRHSDTTEIVFVSEDAVEVREAFQEFPMALLYTKDDFDSPIRNATLMGKAKPDLSSDTPDWVNDIKLEDDDLTRSRASDSSTGKMSNDTVNPSLPPQMLILVLESARLIFLYIACKNSARPGIIRTQKQLPVSRSRMHQIGEFVVVDSESRALAIGAQETYFYLYSLKSKPALEQASRKHTAIMPIDSERLFYVDGVILNMEFLYPSQGDVDHVILLLVVSKKGRSRLIWYEWDTRIDLANAEIKPGSFSLPEESSLPLLLIPLKAHNAFILVGHAITCVYRDILTGTPNQYVLHLGTNAELEEPAASRYRPIWVQWARAVRYRTSVSSRTQALPADDNVYLCREDGLVLYLDIQNNIGHMVESHHSAGRLGASINNAFAVIDLGEYAVDLLVAGGDSGCAGIWQFSPRENATKAHALTSWSPLTDVACISSAEGCETSSCSEHDDEKDSFVACAGSLIRGTINQLGFGIRATSLDTLHLYEALGPPIMDAWTIFVVDHTTYIVISHTESTLVIRMKEGMEPEPLENDEGFILYDRTVLVKSLTLDRLCQVTSRTIIISEGLATASPKILWRKDVEAQEEILSACIDTLHGNSCLTTAVSRHSKFYIVFRVLEEQARHTIQCQIPIEAHPTSMATCVSTQAIILIIGNDTGSLEAFILTQQEQIFRFDCLATWHFSTSDQICDSIVLFSDDLVQNSSRNQIVCGLRNGHVHTFNLNHDTRQFVPVDQIYVGNTTIQLKQAASHSKSSYVSCDNKLFTLELSSASASWSPATLRLVNQSGVPGKPSMAKVLAFVPPQSAQQSLHLRARLLVTITSLGIQFSLFDTAEFDVIPRRRRPTAEPQDSVRMDLHRQFSNLNLTIAPRPFDIEGKPIRTIYSRHLKQLISLLLDVTDSRSNQDYLSRRGVKKRKNEAAIIFVNVAGSQSTSSTQSEFLEAEGVKQVRPTQFALASKPGERFVNIVEWFPRINDMEYHLLLVNTVIKDRRRSATGRLLFYAITTVAGTVVKLELKKSIEAKQPVYNVAPLWDRSSIIYGSGDDLKVLSLKAESTGLKYELQSQLAMRSPARYLSVHEPFIYVSTASQSCQVYTYQDQQICYQYGDTAARNGVCHISIPGNRMLVSTDLNGGVTGFWQPPITQANNAMPMIFEANLPRAITRLFKIRSPSSQRDSLVPGGPILLAQDMSSTSEHSRDTAIHDYRPSALIGTSNDGTFTQMVFIEQGWRLLKFMQQMCENDESICPFKSTTPIHDLEAVHDNAKYLHVNGDILKRLLTEDGAERLLSILEKPAPARESEIRQANSGSSEVRWKSFLKLSLEVLGQDFVENAVGKEVIIKAVLRWVAYVTRSAL